ncbi:MAG: DUF3378 domain-containing protein [Candidatus Diapherotrites archaeon]
MEKVLNFGSKQKRQLIEILREFPQVETKNAFEELRCKAGNCTVTLYSSGKLVVQGNDCKKVTEEILQRMGLEEELVLGIDEAGRGESFGSFVVSFVLGDSNKLRELRDSKKTGNLKEKAEIVSGNALAVATVSLNSRLIDQLRNNGLNLNEIEVRIINNLVLLFDELGVKAKVKADGSRLNGTLKHVEFIVKGDDLEPVIGAASVIAKLAREESKDREHRKSWNVKEK